MYMKKIILSVFALIIGTFLFATGARAMEGQAKLNPTAGNSPTCLASTVYMNSAYHVQVTCRDLSTPYSAEITRYVLWRYDADSKKWFYVGRLDQGKFVGVIGSKFSALQISAEEKNSPREPSEYVVARGDMGTYDFDKGTSAPVVTPMLTVSPTPTSAPVGGGTSIGKIAGTVLRFVVIGFVIILLGVVVMTVISRRREG